MQYRVIVDRLLSRVNYAKIKVEFALDLQGLEGKLDLIREG